MKRFVGMVIALAAQFSLAVPVSATDTGGMTCGTGYTGCLETGMELRDEMYQECMNDSSFNPDPLTCPADFADCKSFHCNNRAETYYSQYVNYCQGLYCSGWQDSPILIYQHQRPELTSLGGGVLFDIDADGDLDSISWTHYGSAPFLALDRNGNGSIDNGSELFGTATVQIPYYGETRNGFVALRSLDANGDRQIDGSDPSFHHLVLWWDRNQDGMSDVGELTAAAVELKSISTEYVTVGARDNYGNLFRWLGRGVSADGHRVKAADIVFVKGE